MVVNDILFTNMVESYYIASFRDSVGVMEGCTTGKKLLYSTGISCLSHLIYDSCQRFCKICIIISQRKVWRQKPKPFLSKRSNKTFGSIPLKPWVTVKNSSFETSESLSKSYFLIWHWSKKNKNITFDALNR